MCLSYQYLLLYVIKASFARKISATAKNIYGNRIGFRQLLISTLWCNSSNIYSTGVTLYKTFRTSAEVQCDEKNAAELFPGSHRPGSHTCVSRIHSGTRCIPIYGHQMLANNLSFRNKKLACSHKSPTCRIFLRGCEACAAICCYCDLWKPRMPNAEKIFCFPEKRARSRNNFIAQYQMRNAIYIPLNAKDLTIHLTMLASGNRQH